MINFDDYAEHITLQELRSHNLRWPFIYSDHTYRTLIIGGYGSGKKCIIEFIKQPA